MTAPNTLRPETSYWASESISTAEALCWASTDRSRERRYKRNRAERIRLQLTIVALTALPFAISGFHL